MQGILPPAIASRHDICAIVLAGGEMKKWIMISCVLYSYCFIETEALPNKDVETIVFLRHGEKPFLGFGQLTCQGFNRALSLPTVLLAKFGKPNYIFASNPYWDHLYYYVRPLITIEPTAIQFGLAVNSQFNYTDVLAVVKELMLTKYHHALLFVTWEHFFIVGILKSIMIDLNADPDVIPFWSADDYDSLYVLTIDWNTNPPKVKFIHDREGLNNQSKICRRVVKPFIKQDDDLFGEIYIFIPAAEPALNVLDQLSCQGLNRAIALSELLAKLYPTIHTFVIPRTETYSSAYFKTKPNVFLRALMTIEPTVILRGGEFILISPEIKSAVIHLRNLVVYNQTVVITWPREDLANFAQAVYREHGGNPNEIPNPVPNIDTIYEITLKGVDETTKPSFQMITENLNNQSKTCP